MMPTSLIKRGLEEAKQLLQLCLPIFIGQLALTGMGATDTIMAGNYHATDLAAIAIGQSFWLPTVIFFVGFFSASTTLIARYHGANNSTAIKRVFSQSMLWAVLFSPLGFLFLSNSHMLVSLLELDSELSRVCSEYLATLAMGLPAVIGFLVIRSLSEGMGKTRPIMLIQLLAFVSNIPLNYLFIFGNWGFPEMGGVGCGIATAIVSWLQCLCGIVLLNHQPILKKLKVFKQSLNFHRHYFLDIWRLGLPISFTFLAEVLLFSVIALIIAPLGIEIIAGHQIALSISALTFMLPLSMGMAITIRAGFKLGAQQQQQANFSCAIGLIMILVSSSSMMLFILLMKSLLASIYSNNLAVVSIASSLLVFTAIYQIPDAIQICMASSLRAYQDTRIPLMIVLIAYWLISVPLGWSLSFGKIGQPMGASGMWLGLVCGLSAAAALLGWRFWLVHKNIARANLSL